jgi:hypothetical protein
LRPATIWRARPKNLGGASDADLNRSKAAPDGFQVGYAALLSAGFSQPPMNCAFWRNHAVNSETAPRLGGAESLLNTLLQFRPHSSRQFFETAGGHQEIPLSEESALSDIAI